MSAHALFLSIHFNSPLNVLELLSAHLVIWTSPKALFFSKLLVTVLELRCEIFGSLFKKLKWYRICRILWDITNWKLSQENYPDFPCKCWIVNSCGYFSCVKDGWVGAELFSLCTCHLLSCTLALARLSWGLSFPSFWFEDKVAIKLF